MSDDDVPIVDGDTVGRLPSLVRAGCVTLIVLGAGSTLLAGPSLLSPASARCSLARDVVDTAVTDKKDWNDVDLGGADAADLSCADAIATAETIPKSKGSRSTLTVPDENAIRIRGIFAVLIGIGQAVTGFLTLRTASRRSRAAALGFASLGVVFPVLGILSVALLVFVAYAIGFSSASQQVWPRPTRPKRGES